MFSTADVGTHAQLSYAELNEGETLPSRAAYLMLERFLGEGLRTRLTILSYADMPLTMTVAVEVAADFADTGEVEHGQRHQHGDVAVTWRPEERELRLDYLREGLDRSGRGPDGHLGTGAPRRPHAGVRGDGARPRTRRGRAARRTRLRRAAAGPAAGRVHRARRPGGPALAPTRPEFARLVSTNLDVAAGVA